MPRQLRIEYPGAIYCVKSKERPLYSYNSANQRTRTTTADGSYWSYEYDALGQVKRGGKFFSDGYPVPGQQFEYGFDDIGNRQSTKAGGDENGANLRAATYTPNTLNQYTSRDVPGAVDVMGLAMGNNSTLTVNSATPWRKGEYFRKELSVANSSAAVWQSVSVAATGETTVSGNVFVPKTPEAFYYDRDGNLTNDERWTYTWDAENRLVNMTSASSAPTGSKLKLDFAYDWKGRRVEKLVSTNNGSSYVAQYTNRFVYDGWNLMAVLAPNLSVIRSFLWGSDLSGSLQGAGGVGGLLAVNDAGNGVHFCAYDGNGNVAALVKATDGTVSATYEYAPFGEGLRQTGLMAKANPFRFSSKYQDDETDLLYYGYRYYNTSTGRWLNRDPIGEQGGINLYGFVANNPINAVDFLGLFIELWYGNHLVDFKFTSGWHSKLWLITDESPLASQSTYPFLRAASKTQIVPSTFVGPCQLWAISIGAGPDKSIWELFADFNRDRDVAEALHNPSLVTSFTTPQEALKFLASVDAKNKTMNGNFDNTALQYHFDPGSSYTAWNEWNEFNSNSYISGLLGSFGYAAPSPGATAPGYSKPIPAFVFTTTFSSTAELKKAWKLHFPGF